MAKNTDQAFESIRVVGGLLGSKVLQDARRYQLPGQSKEDYAIEPGLTFNEEIGRYWRIAQGRWQEFQQQCLREDISSQKIAQNEWLLPLLTRVLGYDITPSQPKQIGEREFPITHVASNGAVPVVLCGADYDLDKGDALFGQEGRKRSPMGLAQEYLNAESDCLWAIVSNGRFLRLLRDNPAMTRPAYIEIDFTKLFDEDNYADFATAWLLLQATRLAPRNNQVEQCWLEQWREKGFDEGERALDKLRYGVADALRELGTGFVAHKNNQALREKLSSGELSTDDYFQQVLRLVYRFLFLLTAEDRDVALLPKDYNGDDYSAPRKLYEQGYSITKLRERARLNRHYDAHGDAWQQLLITFSGFASGQPLLAQPALGGLFANDQCPELETSELENRYLYRALFNLSYFEHNQTLSRINYRDMDTEEFGSVYESLLELIPQLNTEARWQFGFMGDAEDEASASGHSRKLTGSYYTPDSLVQELIKSALEPVIADRLRSNPQHPREAILSITVCDPACGSGHFLLAAARRLASELASIDAGTDQPTEQHFRHAIRDVVRHCIYGVDLNPMAVELCKAGLWLESIEPGKPLTFLDSHIQTGNSLVGIVHKTHIQNGIPDDAFKPNQYDDKKVCNYLKNKNLSSDGSSRYQKSLFDCDLKVDNSHIDFFDTPENSLDDVEKKKLVWRAYRESKAIQDEVLLETAFVVAFLSSKNSDTSDLCPTNEMLARVALGDSLGEEACLYIQKMAAVHNVFHWQINFPNIFNDVNGGFDVILGNPPWDRIQPEANHFFGVRYPDLLGLKRTERQKEISKLERENPILANEWESYRKHLLAQTAFIKGSGQLTLSTGKNINSYAAFAELSSKLVSASGRVGLVLQSGIVTDDANKRLFNDLMGTKRIVKIADFENREGIFKSVHRMFRFCLFVISGKERDFDEPRFVFNAHNVVDVKDRRKLIAISVNELRKISPDTGLCPTFSSEYDFRLVSKMYDVGTPFSVGGFEKDGGWRGAIKRLFSTSYDGEVLVKEEDMEDSKQYFPFYEAKSFYIYDHRFASYSAEQDNYVAYDGHHTANSILTKYYVSELEVDVRMSKVGWDKQYLLAYRDVTNSKNERCAVASIIPKCAPTDTVRVVFTARKESDATALLLANINAMVFDFVAKNVVAGTHLSEYIFRQLPCILYDSFSEKDKTFIVNRVLELTYTSIDLKPFADDIGYYGEPFIFDPERRQKLKCELDAYFAKLYGLTRDELRYILDPTDAMGEDYPSETFRVLKNKELKEFGEYRTQRLVLDAWDKLEAGRLE